MSLTLELTKDVEAALAIQARAAHMPTEQYLAQIVEHAIEKRRHYAAERLVHHLDDMGAQVAPDTSPDQMEAAFDEAFAAVRPQHRVME